MAPLGATKFSKIDDQWCSTDQIIESDCSEKKYPSWVNFRSKSYLLKTLNTHLLTINSTDNYSQTWGSNFPQETVTDLNGNFIKKVLLHKGTLVKASEVSSQHLIPHVTPLPSTTNRHTTLAAEGCLKSMESLGLKDIDHTANGKSILLCKTRLKDVPTEPKNKLRKIKLSGKEYEQSME